MGRHVWDETAGISKMVYSLLYICCLNCSGKNHADWCASFRLIWDDLRWASEYASGSRIEDRPNIETTIKLLTYLQGDTGRLGCF